MSFSHEHVADMYFERGAALGIPGFLTRTLPSQLGKKLAFGWLLEYLDIIPGLVFGAELGYYFSGLGSTLVGCLVVSKIRRGNRGK